MQGCLSTLSHMIPFSYLSSPLSWNHEERKFQEWDRPLPWPSPFHLWVLEPEKNPQIQKTVLFQVPLTTLPFHLVPSTGTQEGTCYHLGQIYLSWPQRPTPTHPPPHTDFFFERLLSWCPEVPPSAWSYATGQQPLGWHPKACQGFATSLGWYPAATKSSDLLFSCFSYHSCVVITFLLFGIANKSLYVLTILPLPTSFLEEGQGEDSRKQSY